MQFPLQHSRSLLCIFIPALLYEDAEVADVEQFGQMAQAMRQTWGSQLTNRTNSEQNEQKSVGPVGQPISVRLAVRPEVMLDGLNLRTDTAVLDRSGTRPESTSYIKIELSNRMQQN